jgi:iron complex transport system substrate-binding protein
LPAVSVRNTQQEHEILDCVRIYAELNGTPERAEQLINAAHEENARFAQQLGILTDQEKPRVLALYLTAEGKIIGSYGAHHVVNVFWARGGTRNASTPVQDSLQLDAERVLRLDPDVVLLEGPMAPSPSEFALDPRWKMLRAVKEHRVYRQPRGLDGFMWNIIDNPLLSRWFAELFYPDRVKPELRKMMKDAYWKSLNYAASDAELDDALAIMDNAGSAGYERFRAGYSGFDGRSQ